MVQVPGSLAENETGTTAENTAFIDEIASMPGGEGVNLCTQCGTCSASCPSVKHMDFSPRKLVAMIRAGKREEVLKSNSPWICASCFMCTVRCPVGLKPDELMHTIGRASIFHGISCDSIKTPTLYAAFIESIKKYGRVNEGEVMLEYYRRTGLLSALRLSSVGFTLLRRGRLFVRSNRIKGASQLKTILKKAESIGGKK